MSIHEASIARMTALKAGDPVTNICAGEKNPQLFGFFVGYRVRSRINRFGIEHRTHLARYTDRHGRSLDIGIELIHPGHLDKTERERLFAPVWQEKYGKPQPAEGQ